MSWFFRFFRRKGFWGSIALIIVLAVIASLGNVMNIPGTFILIGVLILLVVILAIVTIRMMRAGRAATGIEAGIRKQAERDLMVASVDNRADIERMQQQLETAIAQLKQSKLAGDGFMKSGRRALYALPWYVFIGPPGAGKTTAIVHSGLKFPAGSERLRGVGGTRNCDWFLSDQAILLDTAGRYTTEDQDREEWNAFLDILKKHRPDRPINGVLVGISLPEILESSPDEIEWHGETIRKRIDELTEQLGVQVPIYVLFTKTDLLQGFVEFFGDLSRNERDQVWGCTFEEGEARGDQLAPVFDREFNRMHEALLGHRNERLKRAMKREERHRVFAFPLEFGAIKASMSRFLETLFRESPFHENPTLRGVYFTSGTQEGLPIDRVIQAVAARFDLPAHYGDIPDPMVETKSYFLTDLFRNVVIPDQGMARRTGRSVKRARLATTGFGVAATVLLGLFVLASSQALVRSKVELNRLNEVSASAASINWNARIPGDLERLDELREAVQRAESGPPILQMGLGRRGTVREPAQRLYYSQARGLIESTAINQILQSLRTGGDRIAGGYDALAFGVADADSLEEAYQPFEFDANLSAGERERAARRARVYDDLKAYLLLTDERERLEERTQREWLRAHLGSLAQHSIIGADTTGRGNQAEMIFRQVHAYVDGLAREVAQPFTSEARLVASARDVIYEPPSIAGLYNRIKQDAMFALDPFELSHAVPGQYLSLFEPAGQIPGAFTREGWDEVIGPAFEAESRDPNRDDWVMGREGVALPEGMQDPAEIRLALEQRYFTEYAQTWDRWLRQIRYRPFGDMASAGRQLNILSSPTDSPLLWLLAVVTEQTTFPVDQSTGLSESAANVASRVAGRLRMQADARTGGLASAAGVNTRISAGGSGGNGSRNSVEQAFAGIHALNAPAAPEGNAAPELYGALEALGQLSGILQGLSSDPAQAADYAAQVLQQNGGGLAPLLNAVESGTRRLPNELRQSLFIQPVRAAWGDILGTAQSHLNRRWREEVYQPFQATLEGRYPLDPRSTNDAPLGDFEQFFSPAGGVLSTFVAQTLAPFLTSDGRSARSWQGRGIGLSQATQNAIDQARRIGEGMFSGNTMRVEFEMQADVPAREGDAPAPDQVYVNIHGVQDSYRMGSYRPWVSYTWPGSPGAMVGLSTRHGELPPRRFDGDWAIFRLLQNAEVRRSSPTEYAARWVFRQEGQYALTVRYDLRARSAVGPFADPGGFFRFACPASLN